jgi:hypothetical protein
MLALGLPHSLWTKLFLISGILPLVFALPFLVNLKGDTIPLIYSIFVFVYFFQEKLKPFTQRIKLPPLLKFYLIATLLGCITETFVFVSDRSGAIGHQENIFLNFFMSIGWYSIFTGAWVLMIRKYFFSLPQVFFLQGFVGLVIEQQGAVFVSILQNPLGIVWAVYTIPIYGSFVAAAFVLTRDELQLETKKDTGVKYLLFPIFVILLLLLLVFMDELIKRS